MSGAVCSDFQRAVWDAQGAVESIKGLAETAAYTANEMTIDDTNVQAVHDRKGVASMQDGIAALADKAIEKLDWIETAWRERWGSGDGA